MKKRNILLLGLSLLFGSVPLYAQGVDERGILAAASGLDHAIDDKNWKRVRALLLKEVTLVTPGMEPETLPADKLIERWKANLHAGKKSFHLRGSEVVTFDGADSAVLRSKVQTWYQVEGIAGDDVYEVWADYVHELDRGEDGWRVRRIGLTPRLERGNLAVRDHRMPAADAAAADGSISEADADKANASGGDVSGGAATVEGTEQAAGTDAAQADSEPAAAGNETTDKATADDASPGPSVTDEAIDAK